MPKWVTFDDDWRFWRGEAEGAEARDFDDAPWRLQDTPHDWSIEDLPQAVRSADNLAASGPFDKEASAGGFMVGWAVGGTGWYRKHFRVPERASDGKRWEVWFDGSYRDTDAWLNGVPLGPTHHGGYTPFHYTLTPHLISDAENVLAVRVKNEGHNSRWYSGSGLLRHVYLVSGPSEARITPNGGVFVTTVSLDAERATVRVAVEVEGKAEAMSFVQVRLLDSDGTEVSRGEQPSAGLMTVFNLFVDSPRPWHPDHPALYRAEVTLFRDGPAIDRAECRFGTVYRRTVGCS